VKTLEICDYFLQHGAHVDTANTTHHMVHHHHHHHHTTTVLRPFFREYPGEPAPEENFWNLWCKGRLTEADTLTIRVGATPSRLTSAHLHHHTVQYMKI